MLNDIIKLLKRYDITLSELLEFFHKIQDIGLPPSINSKAEMRKWLRDAVPILEEITSRTPAAFDDELLIFLAQVLRVDEQWDSVHNLLLSVYSRFQTDARSLAMAPSERVMVEDIWEQVDAYLGIDLEWNQIMEAIKLIIDLIELLRGQDNG